MKYTIDNKNIILYQNDFNLDETLDCGQAFRWKKDDNSNCYTGFSSNHYLKIEFKDNCFILHNTSENDFLNIWVDYFDLNTNYSELKQRYSNDKILKSACEYAPGIRLLKQNKWEALCSFIISQNNNIPRIKGIIERLCETFGEKQDFGYGFPSAQKLASLTVEDLAPLRAGFRARYILDAAQKVSSGEINLEAISKLPYENARKELMNITGVGVKVADCALLYGMYRTEAFPIDVWIKRVMATYYPDGLPECAIYKQGIAQQYLFHYIRNLEKTTV